MNTDFEQKLSEDDHVEVLVEDLFIEEYESVPLALVAARPAKRPSRLTKVTRPIRENATSLLGGIAAIAGLMLAALFLSSRRRKGSGLQRMFHRLAR